MKTSTQLKALVRNLSKKANVEAEILLRNFMQERFLERIAFSDYKNSFILKGGMLIAAMVGIDTRTTMDKAAMQKTVEKRGTSEQMMDMPDAIEMIMESPVMIDLWEKYRKKYSYAADVTWEMTIDALRVLAEKA